MYFRFENIRNVIFFPATTNVPAYTHTHKFIGIAKNREQKNGRYANGKK